MARTFTKIGKEIELAVLAGGPDPSSNLRLRLLMQTAKSESMPKENVERAIKRATEKDKSAYKEVVYDGKGPHGTAFVVETATDNPTRTVANIRAAFVRGKGELGTMGMNDFLFERKCSFVVAWRDDIDMDELELELIDCDIDEVFRDYLKRDFINLRKSTPDDLREFLKGKDIVFAKETKGEGGHGISKCVVKDITDVEAFYNRCKENGQYLIEDGIKQHPDLNQINPNVVNSFRVITLLNDKGEIKMIANALRVNQDDSVVIGCTNDLYFSLGADGKIDSNVVDDYGQVYDTHPLTGVKFKDVYIHGVQEAFDMCIDAHKRIPQCRYIGWDIAFSENGPVIVEGNEYPGYGLVQHYALKNKRTGHLKEVADHLGDEYNRIKL